jgi:transposase
MPTTLRVRALTAAEREQIKRVSQARTAPARAVERARMIQLASEGLSVPAIAQRLARAEKVVRRWVVRFNAEGLHGLQDKPRSGRPTTYSREEVGVVVATALTDPKEVGQAFGSWTFARLERYLNEERGLAIKRSRIHELLQAEGLRWREQETWFGARVDPDFAPKRGR